LYHKPAIATLLLLMISIVSVNSYAQLSVNDEEKAVFAFLKLAAKKPNLGTWITHSTKYQQAAKFDKERLLETEKIRLGGAFGTYNVKKDFIKIKSNIRLISSVDTDGKAKLTVRFTDHELIETPYFPFPYGEQSIALIVSDLNKFLSVELTPEEAQLAQRYLHSSAPYEAKLELRIRPLSVDASAPLQIDGIEQWLMMGDIAYLKILFHDEYKRKEIAIWDYNAPWYLSESQRELLDLFKE